MAEVIPASGDDWREIERRASMPEGHIERALLEILQRLVPVENRVVPVEAQAAGGVAVTEESACVPSGVIAADWLSYHPRMVADAAPAGGVTAEELAWILDDIHSGWGCPDQADWLLSHPQIGPLLRGEGQAPGAAPVRVVLPKDPPPHLLPSPDDDGWGYVVRATWAAARAEVERQQGGGSLMQYTKTEPCADCPFLNGTEHGYTDERLMQFASSAFPCHKTAKLEDGGFVATGTSVHCAGALIYLEKRDMSNQMMRIAERLGMYDSTKLNMEADVR